jgi:uncharacterized protein (TIGR01244 family)
MPSLKRTFLLAVLLGLVVVISVAATKWPAKKSHVLTKPLAASVWVTEQIDPRQLADIKSQGFRSVVDLRPDGEVRNQPASPDVGRAAQQAGLAFSYVPVPHGNVPASSVDMLGAVLQHADRPILLYCRSGHRAARTWALAEASRPGGLNGQIMARISSRPMVDQGASIHGDH